MTLLDHARQDLRELEAQLAERDDELREALDRNDCLAERVRDLEAVIGATIHTADTWVQVAPCQKHEDVAWYVHMRLDEVMQDQGQTEAAPSEPGAASNDRLHGRGRSDSE